MAGHADPTAVLGKPFSGRDLILFIGGLFLLFKGTMELHERLEGSDHHHSDSRFYAGFWPVVAQIVILDAVFSIDAVITAVMDTASAKCASVTATQNPAESR